MALPQRRKLLHIPILGKGVRDPYAANPSISKRRQPIRDRRQHAARILRQLESLRDSIADDSASGSFEDEDVIKLEFSGEPGFDLALESLDLISKGIQLLAVNTINERITAAVRIPRSKLAYFIDKVRQYRDTNSRHGRPNNQYLIETISNIRLASVQSLWTDSQEDLPTDPEQLIWWEIWLQKSSDGLDSLRNFAGQRGVRLSENVLSILDCDVVLAHAPTDIIADAIIEVGAISELRKAKEVATDFTEMPVPERIQWTAAALGLIDPPATTAPSVCLLDTGVNRGHPLLEIASRPDAMLSVNPAWGTNDHHRHGTEMAGLALYGDLIDLLLSTERRILSHWLESVKIIPPGSETPTEPDLYGEVTAQATRLIREVADRKRVHCLTVMSDEGRDRGAPSSWSAKIDEICFGTTDEIKKLFLISAGNCDPRAGNYQDQNLIESIHDPGQSWNAITVGAYTTKDRITEASFAGYTPIAPAGDLSPSSTTSSVWTPTWAIKPDVVFEGGNWARDSADLRDCPESLSLLTTSHDVAWRHLSTTGETSAATAIGSQLAGSIFQKYDWAWPETVRGLIVHSARWTEQMRRRYARPQDRVRIYGHGTPDYERALWSASNALTLVVQDSLQPFEKHRMNELKLHALPWPSEVLESMGEEQVKLRVTLSYFIEPSPARRGWKNRYKYQSHGLRFAVKRAAEDDMDFYKRINAARRSEDEAAPGAGSDPGWVLGYQSRFRGSIHSDTWVGTAADLATRSAIAVYPVVGWWRERKHLNKWGSAARYSLIVSVITDRTDVDIYTPVEIKVATEIST